MKFGLTLILSIVFHSIFAQTIVNRCGTDARMHKIFESKPSYEMEIEKGFDDFNAKRWSQSSRNQVITIPVHVIVVHPPGQPIGSGRNISFERIQSQIDVINEDFGRYNGDAANTPPEFSAGDTGIQFCLATMDPNGNATDGVTRYGTDLNFENNEFDIKLATKWPRDTYLNIWVAELNGVLGFAYLPSTGSLPDPTLDGVAVGTEYFGGPGQATGFPYDLGRTATHEIGHFLGLRHVWRNDGCGLDDGIADTPLQDDENFGCPNHPSPSCGNSGDMFMNYMDYSNDACMNAFSVGQGNYMNTILNTSRSSLASSSGFACAAPNPLAAEILGFTHPLCTDDVNGTITVRAEGGSGAYTYTLHTGQSNSTGFFEDLAADNYTITVEDGNESIDLTVDLINPEALVLDLIETLDNLCFGDKKGVVIVEAMGGTSGSGNYFYEIDGIGQNQTGIFNGLKKGSYPVYVYDDNDCFSAVFADIASPDSLGVSFLDTTAISCYGDSTGSFRLQAFGGRKSYKYFVDSMRVTNLMLDSLWAGIYPVMVIDTNNCVARDTFRLMQPAQLTTDIDTTVHIRCFGEKTGEIGLRTSGGTPGYRYVIGGDTSTLNRYSNLSSGIYYITSLDTNNCVDRDTVALFQPEQLGLDLAGRSNPLCKGISTGYLEVSANGGQAPYTYRIEQASNTNGLFEQLPPGSYPVVVTDGNGCTFETVFDVERSPPFEVDYLSSDVLCYGESNGWIKNITGLPGNDFEFVLEGHGSNTTGVFEMLSPATYIMTTTFIRDQCSETDTVTITEPSALSATTEIVYGGIPGVNKLTVEAVGGTPPYTYAVGDINNAGTNAEIFNIPPGVHPFFVIDANHCIFETTIGISALNEASSIPVQIFPNPAFDVLVFRAESGLRDARINMYSADGKIVDVFIRTYSRSEDILEADVQHLQPGLYTIEIRMNNALFKHKFIKI